MSDTKVFEASPEAKGKAKQFRIISIIAWVIAIAGEIYAILNLISDDMMTWLIVAIVIILALAVTGNILWKKANKLDPASEKEPTRFFIQNQLGAIISAIGFLPLLILILTNKNISGKTKGIAGSIAGVALAIAVATGVELDPASIEKYTEEIQTQNEAAANLNINSDAVFWSTAGNKYHAYEDCHHIADRTISTGSIKESFELKGLSELCKTCQKKAAKASVSSGVKELIGTE